MNFNVGDWVRINRWPVSDHEIGDVGVIASGNPKDGWNIEVPGKPGTGWYECHEIERAAPPTPARHLPVVPEGMTSDELADYVAAFVDAARSRVLGVGADQYANGGRQLFEGMTPGQLIEMAREEAQDLAVYAAMLDIRLARIAAALDGKGINNAA